MELLDHFGTAPGQLMPNSWRIVVSYMGIWLVSIDRDILRVDELVYLYRLKAPRSTGTMNWFPGRKELGSSKGYLRLSGMGSPDFSLCLGMILRLPLTGFGVSSRGCIVGGEPRL